MAGQNPGSPTDFQYFYEDEVYKINNHGQVVFGLVLENYEANSSDQESDIDTPIQKGEIRVVWHPSGTERVISEKTVGLADRSLMPGDVVRRLIAGKDTQRGYCRDIIMTAALQVVGTKHVIPCVASERLQPLEEFTPDLAVCLDSWVGTSKAVHSKLRLVSADGSRLEYPDLDSCPLEDYSMRRRRSTPYSSSEFYPGQVVYGPLGALDFATWLHITKEMKAARKHKMHEHKFTVEAVVTESVSVHWQCRALWTNPADSTASQTTQPNDLVEGEALKNLKLLNVFEPCTLQVGDRNFLTIESEDTFVSKKQWKKQQSKYYRHLRKQTKPSKKPSKSETNSMDHMPSRPKKRASSHRKLKSSSEMDVDPAEELECPDDGMKTDANCPSIRIEPSGDAAGPTHEDCAVEEKNDSGISPEPAKEDSCLLNGDSKSDAALNDDDSDNWENTSSDGSDTDSGATWSSRCSSAASATGGARGKRSPQLAVRLLRGKRLKRTVRRAPPAPPPQRGDRVVVETLHTTSCANVVWQDGTIEMGIPSTQLYPIHHLDGQECFPGDFVVSGAADADENQPMKHREYGVVQRVDHHGRTAIVHWYRTYSNVDDPVPQLMSESEMSVYDLKDHPDFQYRPGTVVIRVANFAGEDANCTAGQVIDNFPSGRVKVWWVDGHTSMCWPQDLYKVGEYDSEEGDPYGSDESDTEESWETQNSAHDGTRTPEAPSAPDAPSAPPAPPPAEAPIAPGALGAADTGAPPEPEGGGVLSVPRLLEPRVAVHIERGRVAMRRLEEMFAKHPTLQSQEIMRKLLNLYKDCRFLDRLMGTSFFHEDHFLGLLERVRERGGTATRAGERRLQEQLARLFTPSEEPSPQKPHDQAERADDDHNVAYDEPMEVEGVLPKKQPEESTDTVQASGSQSSVNQTESGENESAEPTDADGSARNVCYKLCSLIHAQLQKAHAEVSRRRPQELAEFLNSLMKKQSATQEKLLYHFSVQYGALVVSMVDQEGKVEEGGAAKGVAAKGAAGTDAVPNSEAPSSMDTASPAVVESAAVGAGAGVDAAVPRPPACVEGDGGEGFRMLESAPPTHRFRLSMLQPSEPRSFYTAVNREIKLMNSDLPSGVWVRGYEDRTDLLSVMIAGPAKTPYEGGLFVFDVQLGGEYPRTPPLCHYHSYCTDRLNPNLYEDGKVCVSLLGTWSGRGVEVWGRDSSLLQVIVSLQGLILNAEPYFNEAGYEKQKGTQQGEENSRMYNEMVLLKLVQSMTKMVSNPPEPFREEILRHVRATGAALCRRLEGWVALSNGAPPPAAASATPPPDFPLVPASRGFCLTLRSSLDAFRNALRRNNITVPPSTL